MAAFPFSTCIVFLFFFYSSSLLAEPPEVSSWRCLATCPSFCLNSTSSASEATSVTAASWSRAVSSKPIAMSCLQEVATFGPFWFTIYRCSGILMADHCLFWDTLNFASFSIQYLPLVSNDGANTDEQPIALAIDFPDGRSIE